MNSEAKILRITTVSHSLDLLLKGQLKYVGEKGYKVFIACTPDDKVKDIESRENVVFVKLRLTRKFSPLADLVSLFNAINLIRKIKPDIVHTHSPKAGIVGMLAAWFCRVPVKIHTVAGLPLTEATGFKRKLLILVERVTYIFADYVLPNSVKQKEYIEQHIYKNEKIRVIGKGSSNGIDLDYYDPSIYNEQFISDFRSKYDISSDDTVFCFVGRLAYYKGVNELVRAFNRLNIKRDTIKLFLVGPLEELNPLEPATLSIIDSNSNIISVGHQNDIRPFLALSDIFVFPSYREGFPQSLMQAAAMNLACIATDINGCNEILEDRVSGLLIPTKNEEALYLASEELLENPVLRNSLAQRARATMEDGFEQKTFWDKIIQFYKEAL